MTFTPEVRSFLSKHSQDDPNRLLLSASRYPDVDVRWVAEQIIARRQIKAKLPEWYEKADDLVMGGRIPAEQCSSEQTARYKQQLVVGTSLCDLTGGMGVDCYYMSRGVERAIYTERQPHLCEAARHNFSVLGAGNIEVREGDGRLLPIPDADTIYLDPARRAGDGSRVYDISACEPDVVGWRHELLRHCKRLVVKLSPMADVSRTLAQLPETTQVHIVAVRNECKEVLVVMEPGAGSLAPDGNAGHEVMVHCVDFRTSDEVRFSYAFADEANAGMAFADLAQMNGDLYLYEPDVTVMKAGAFRLMCSRYGVQKLDANSHLYVSDHLINDFPGRIFMIEQQIPFSSKVMKHLSSTLPQANIATRNFPLTADALRKRTGIRDGGDKYVYGTICRNLGQMLFVCRKCLMLLLLLTLCVGDMSAARRKKKAPEMTVDMMLQDIRVESPGLWIQGMPFTYVNDVINQTLHPEVPDAAFDTLDYRNTQWTFHSIVSEEDWMGRQMMSLRFCSPQGRMYRYTTGRLMSQLSDTTYHPTLPGLLPLDPVRKADSVLRGKEFYLMINDERLITADSVPLTKFVPVVVDSVTVGTESSPLCVWISHPKGVQARFMTSLSSVREGIVSAPVSRFLSLTDPYLKYPDITRETWTLISSNQVRQGMTLEEVRLSWGRPQRFERITTKVGLVERWHYQDRRVLEFHDGHLDRIAIER